MGHPAALAGAQASHAAATADANDARAIAYTTQCLAAYHRAVWESV